MGVSNRGPWPFPARVWLLLVNLWFLASSLLWIHLIPFDEAPDEWTHFHYNVEFLLDHGRLPVSGRDDLSAYQTGRPNEFGRWTGRISYAVHPALNYVVAAGMAAAGERLLDLERYQGARLASCAWGLLFVNLLYLGVREVTGSPRRAAAVAAVFAFIPQILFISSYLNQDVHSLAISALLAWMLARLARRPTLSSILGCGLAVGLLFSAKYNYFVYVPFLAALAVAAFRSKGWPVKVWLRLALSVSLGTLTISGFWFLRNLRLYGDALGLRHTLRVMETLQDPGVSQSLNGGTLIWMHQHGFSRKLLESFFGRFGYLDLPLPAWQYDVAAFTLLCAVLGMLLLALRRDGRALRGWFAGWCLLAAACVGQVITSSLRMDFQPQGRYLYPLVAPTALLAGLFVRERPGLFRAIPGLVSLMLFLDLSSHGLLLRRYGAANIEALPAPVSTNPVPTAEPFGAIPALRGTSQSFMCPRDGLMGIAIYLRSPADRDPALYKLELRDDESGELLRESYFLPHDLQGEGYRHAYFRAMESSAGHRMNFTLFAVQPRGATWLLVGHTGDDAYRDGALSIGGYDTGREALFQLVFRRGAD